MMGPWSTAFLTETEPYLNSKVATLGAARTNAPLPLRFGLLCVRANRQMTAIFSDHFRSAAQLML